MNLRRILSFEKESHEQLSCPPRNAVLFDSGEAPTVLHLLPLPILADDENSRRLAELQRYELEFNKALAPSKLDSTKRTAHRLQGRPFLAGTSRPVVYR